MSSDVNSEMEQRQDLSSHFRDLVGKFVFDEQFAEDNWDKLKEDPESVLLKVGLDLKKIDDEDAKDILQAFHDLDWPSVEKLADAFYYLERAGT